MPRTIVVTGAAGGIGRALCPLLSGAGDRLLLIDHPDSGVEGLAQGMEASAIASCPLSFDECDRALAQAGEEIHGFVHLAGTFTPDPVLGADPEVWRSSIQNNLENAYNFATAMSGRMPKGQMGRLVFVSSLAFRRGGVDHVAYSSAKGGLVGMTRALARRFRSRQPLMHWHRG